MIPVKDLASGIVVRALAGAGTIVTLVSVAGAGRKWGA